MRRRLDLAASLVGRPHLLYLDEPTTGLDPRARAATWRVVRAMVSEGVTVLLTTQYLEEADQLADRVVVLDAGRVVAEGRPEELKRRVGAQTLQLRPLHAGDGPAVARILVGLTGEEARYDRESGTFTLPVRDPGVLSAVVRALDAAGVEAEELSLRLPGLDEVFLGLTGGDAVHTAA